MLFEHLRRRKLQKAFTQYIHVLGPALVKRYGLLDQFTVMQVQTTVKELQLDSDFIAYAVALYRHEASENTINLLRVDQAFLDQLRKEIADSIFNGHVEYNAEEVFRLSKRFKWQGGPPPDWMANRRGQTSL